MPRLFIAEKPSLARAIAEVLPTPHQRRDGYIECGDRDIVTWCAGHILKLAAPDAYDPEYKHWRIEHLPITPREWKLSVTAPDILKTIKALLPKAAVVVNAGDPDREGQLLIDEVLVYLGYRGPVERVLVNDLNPPAVRKAVAAIEPNAKYRPLYEAALGRQRADWLFGLNMTRLYTILGRAAGYEGVLSVGRVQTPLLGLIVRRDLEIERFVSQPYFQVRADLAGASEVFAASWQPSPAYGEVLDDDGRVLSAAIASQIVRKTSGQRAVVKEASSDRRAEQSPLPYSLADLQVDAGRRFGLTPKQVLDIAQALYETHRLITYPRSDCSQLPQGHLDQAPDVVRAMATIEPQLAGAAKVADLTLRSRAWNDSKVTAHHAIIPTPRTIARDPLSAGERRVYDLIARRYLAQFYPAFEYDQRKAHISIAGENFLARGRQVITLGWRSLLDPSPSEKLKDDGPEDEEEAPTSLPPLLVGQELRATRTLTVEKKTNPPQRFTASSLVGAMTGIARYVTDARIKQLLRETDGIGTPATQASIIQTLFERGFVEDRKRQIISTPTGRALIEVLPDVATQPDLTALWEATLRRVQEGQAPLAHFLDAVRSQLGELVGRGRAAGPLRMPGVENRPCPAPGCGGSLRLRAGQSGRFWACSRYPECRHTASVEKRPLDPGPKSRRRGARSRRVGGEKTP